MDYAAALERFELRPVARGPWAVVGRTKREQGWKLHLSTIPTEATTLIAAVLPLLREHGVSFKLARDENVLRQLNEGSFGATQIGKFMTIYPTTNREARELALALTDLTQTFSGPVIVTDLRLGDIVYARYGPFSPSVLRDRLGQTSIAVRLPSGELVPHEYSVPFEVPHRRANPFCDLTLPADDVDPSANGLLGPGYLILDLLRSSGRGSVFLALDATAGNQAASLCVLKEGRRHCFSDSLGRDMRARLQHQAVILEALSDTLPVPTAGPYFEVAGNGYLPLEYIAGADLAHEVRGALGSLGGEDQERILSRLIQLSQLIRALHTAGYVHRDVKPSNFRVTPEGVLHMIDLELAHSLASSTAPYGKGTPGFMSPQQQAEEAPSIADDIYVDGAVALYRLTGIHPLRLVYSGQPITGPQLTELALARPALMEVVARCLEAVADRRPSLDTLETALSDPADSRAARPRDARSRSLRSQVRAAARKLLPSTAEGLLHDACLDSQLGLWLSQAPEQQAGKALAAPEYRLYRSANRGVAGVVYCLARLAAAGHHSNELQQRSSAAIDWLLAHEPTSDDQLPGLHFGEAGVAVAVAEAIRAELIEPGRWLDEYLAEALHGPLDWLDLTHGAAGQGIAAICCADLLEDPTLLSAADRCADFLVASQDNDGGWTTPPGAEGLSGARLTGFAHGAAGIIYFLCEYAARSRNPEATNSALRGADWLIAQARPSSNGGTLEWPTREGSDDVWKWWCHGAPGIALTWLKLFEHYRDPRHETLAVQSLHCHPTEVRYSNLSVCHGLAGLGEIYLEAARILEDREWPTRADRIGNVLVQLARPADHGTVWLVEDGLVPTADLMVGCAGITHFLLRLSSDNRLSFPLLP
jgi:serine/threonine protein kinase